jgi:hypothetical protein
MSVQSEERKLPALYIMTNILRGLGILIGGLTVLAVIAAISGARINYYGYGNFSIFGLSMNVRYTYGYGSEPGLLGLFVVTVLTVLIGVGFAILLYGFGEFIRLLMGMEANQRTIREEKAKLVSVLETVAKAESERMATIRQVRERRAAAAAKAAVVEENPSGAE